VAPFLALRKTISFLCLYAEIKVRPHGGNLRGLSAEWLVCRRAVYLSGPCTVKASFLSIELRNPLMDLSAIHQKCRACWRLRESVGIEGSGRNVRWCSIFGTTL
jgi:hypothetical protein